MDASRTVSEVWQQIVAEGRLADHKPEEVAGICRRLDPVVNAPLLGALLSHLSAIAVRYLTPRVNPKLPNGGKDAVDHVRDGMHEAILDPGSADGEGYAKAFYPKLSQRLIDEIRRERKSRDREEPFALDEEGDEIEPADGVSLGPEEHAILNTILQRLPENQRKAFLLRRAGYEYYSYRADVATIASTLKISDKTARKWVADAERFIRKELGATK